MGIYDEEPGLTERERLTEKIVPGKSKTDVIVPVRSPQIQASGFRSSSVARMPGNSRELGGRSKMLKIAEVGPGQARDQVKHIMGDVIYSYKFVN